jgi:dihydrofolate reductase
MFSMICAIGRHREIGYQNKLLWNLKGDMQHFVAVTREHTVVMGQKTYDSLFIKPLPGRKNIVLTRDKDFRAPGCEIFYSLEDFLAKYQSATEEIFIIGGASIYEQFLPYANNLYLTLVDDAPEADTFFPNYSTFKIVSEGEEHEEKGIKFKFVKLEK